jgi:phosphoglycolate phosphatase-like HAD superfamily hydrolase
MRTAAVLLDFDGTLVESLAVKIEAFRKLYAPFGSEVEERAVAHYRAHTGVSRLERIRHCHRELLGAEPSDAVVKQISDRFGELVEDRVVASAWVPGAEAFLAAYCGVLPLFVVSATPQAELDRIVARRGMDRYFVDIFGSPPDKMAILHEIIATHWLAPETVVMVGDGRADHDAAAANGVRFVGRVPPGEPDPFPPATARIADLAGLAPWLGSIEAAEPA